MGNNCARKARGDILWCREHKTHGTGALGCLMREMLSFGPCRLISGPSVQKEEKTEVLKGG